MGIPTPIIIFVVLILILGIYFMTNGNENPKPTSNIANKTTTTTTIASKAGTGTGVGAGTTPKEEGVTIGQLQEAIGTPPPSSATSNTQATSQEAISDPPPIPGVAVATATDDSVPDVPIGPVPVPVPVPASVNCVGEWGSWGDCSLPCGGGVKTRTYTHTRAAANGGKACDVAHQSQETEACNTQACPVIATNCVGAWSEWTDCSRSCGGGNKARRYTVSIPATGGGQVCPANDGQIEEQKCNPQPCPVNCVGAWGNWGACSRSCAGGKKSRTYAVTTPASGGGQACPATNGQEEQADCNQHPCPIACVGDWGQWGACSASCGRGEQTRTFTVVTPAENGGATCVAGHNEVGRQACNTQPCPVNCVGAWGNWNTCSKPAQGYQSRRYTITTPAANGGAGCPVENGAVGNQYCNLDVPELFEHSTHHNNTVGPELEKIIIPGPSTTYGELEFRLRYKHRPSTWTDQASGLRLYVNAVERAYLRHSRSSEKNIGSPWTRIKGVKGGDQIQLQDISAYTGDGYVEVKFHPNADGNHPASGTFQTSTEYW